MSETKREWITLKNEWYDKLKDSGFIDIEDKKGRLKSKDFRPYKYLHMTRIFNFFRKLDHYLQDHPELPERDRVILTLYSDGLEKPEIVEALKLRFVGQIGMSKWVVKEVIQKYRHSQYNR